MPKPDEKFMRMALKLAERGRGWVEPNPVVGCVLVKGGRVVGRGYHRKFGGPHAEVEAIRAAAGAAHGSTAYVTLEPCCHFGKTGPCTRALIAAGVAGVVVACKDPFEPVAGRGLAELRRAGLKVELGMCGDDAKRLNAPFFKGVHDGLPYVIAKWAATMDGAIATASGDSKWISNEVSRGVVHELRARVDAVIVGIGTVLADDPRLTARGVKLKRVARRVVIDPQLKLPLDSQLIKSLRVAPLTVATGLGARPAKAAKLAAMGVDVMVFGSGPGAFSARDILRHLYKRHAATNVLVEGGGGTLGHFFERDCVDEVWVFTGPRVLGDPAAVRPLVFPNPAKKISKAPTYKLIEARALGDDVWAKYIK